MFLKLNTKQYEDQWVCYTLKDSTGQLLHVGIVAMTALTALNDVDRTKIMDDEVYLTIIDSDIDKMKLANRANLHYPSQVQLIYQRWTAGPKKYGKPVRCSETGKTWASIRACCDDRGLTYTQLINHLNGMSGYKTVKKKIYSFC